MIAKPCIAGLHLSYKSCKSHFKIKTFTVSNFAFNRFPGVILNRPIAALVFKNIDCRVEVHNFTMKKGTGTFSVFTLYR